ncbi:hypothetical protein EGR_06233 [Echinococcus granulosus]|uniref:Uncharacterized protein n=1 Tax=Echinococcus granulosus TaxID=6210 RepID=W6ULC7_ECHGR|nr:hypothetical protein EGR_06233 [Echinococcus granulosus]EUB58917.1 hypothetical protein EGR_06233 [Echinococcus granulosus]
MMDSAPEWKKEQKFLLKKYVYIEYKLKILTHFKLEKIKNMKNHVHVQRKITYSIYLSAKLLLFSHFPPLHTTTLFVHTIQPVHLPLFDEDQVGDTPNPAWSAGVVTKLSSHYLLNFPTPLHNRPDTLPTISSMGSVHFASSIILLVVKPIKAVEIGQDIKELTGAKSVNLWIMIQLFEEVVGSGALKAASPLSHILLEYSLAYFSSDRGRKWANKIYTAVAFHPLGYVPNAKASRVSELSLEYGHSSSFICTNESFSELIRSAKKSRDQGHWE